ncbi:putative uncharacterized protein DDB_G0286901 isoform X1 [Lates japonicus]
MFPNDLAIKKALGLFQSVESMLLQRAKEVQLETNEVEAEVSVGHLKSTRPVSRPKDLKNDNVTASDNVTTGFRAVQDKTASDNVTTSDNVTASDNVTTRDNVTASDNVTAGFRADNLSVNDRRAESRKVAQSGAAAAAGKDIVDLGPLELTPLHPHQDLTRSH